MTLVEICADDPGGEVSQVHLRAQAPSSRGYARTSAGLVAELVGALRGMPVKH